MFIFLIFFIFHFIYSYGLILPRTHSISSIVAYHTEPRAYPQFILLNSTSQISSVHSNSTLNISHCTLNLSAHSCNSYSFTVFRGGCIFLDRIESCRDITSSSLVHYIREEEDNRRKRKRSAKDFMFFN